jgi:hypothetical protein
MPCSQECREPACRRNMEPDRHYAGLPRSCSWQIILAANAVAGPARRVPARRFEDCIGPIDYCHTLCADVDYTVTVIRHPGIIARHLKDNHGPHHTTPQAPHPPNPQPNKSPLKK